MSGDKMKLYAHQVLNIADKMEKENQNLTAELERSQKIMDGLKDIWRGEAADATVDSYNSFYKKYADQYQQDVDSYVQFLRKNVAEGYFQVEKQNKGLAAQF